MIMNYNLVKFNQEIKDYLDQHLYEDISFWVDYSQLDNFKPLGFKVVNKSGKSFEIKRKGLNPYAFSDNNKRYQTLEYYYQHTFNTRIAKVAINAGFTCPNIDGAKSFNGCSFCSIKGSGDFAGNPIESLKQQWDSGYQRGIKKWPTAKFIAYFQAFSNTYAPLEVLKEKYDFFINMEDCFGISIATRADCLEEETVAYLAELNKIKPIWVEVGLQTMHDRTSEIINRAHSLEEFEDGINLLKKYNINTIVHIINGLPGETYDMMLDTAKYVANLNVHGIKIHLLHVTSDTRLVNQLNNGFLKLMDEDEYIKLVCEQLTYLPPKMVIHRLTGDAPLHLFIGPIWSKKKVNVLNKIDMYLQEHNMYQGMNYED